MADLPEKTDIPYALLDLILKNVSSYLYVSDAETDEILFINESLRKHFGLNESPLGKRCWEVMREGRQDRCEYCPVKELGDQPGRSIEWQEYNPDTGRYYSNSDSLIEWADGRLAHLHHRVDVTDIKNQEKDLKRQLDQQELMSELARSFISPQSTKYLIENALRMCGEFMEVSKVLIASFDECRGTLDGSYVWYNDRHAVERQGVMGMPFNEGIPEYNAFILDRKSYLAIEDTSADEVFSHAHSDGLKAVIGVPIYVFGHFWGMLSFGDSRGPRRFSKNDVQLVELIGTVISGVVERQQREDRLARMSSIVNSSPQFIAYINEKGQLEYLNPTALTITGMTESELLGKDFSAAFGKEPSGYMEEQIFPQVKKQGTASFETSIPGKNGENRIWEVSAFATWEQVPGIGTIAADITEKRKLEADLKAATEEAVQASMAKSDFLSRMSHEIRTPLNAIIGMTKIGLASASPEKQEYCLEKINGASTHLLGVINDILDMSKIEANKFELVDADFVLEEMLARIVNVVSFRSEEKKQNLIVDLDPALPHAIIADDQRLAQVIANLLSNAVKFTPEFGLIKLAVQKEDDEGDVCTLRFDVTDSGIGITPEQQKRLFSSFEQADSGISRRFGGTGLGLTISKRIVEMMGGTIGVKSQKGKGATFSFTIRAGIGHSRKTSLAENADKFSGIKILAVDDAPEVREYFVLLAERFGMICDVAADGFEACRRVEDSKGQPYSVIFIDWKMPGMNGIELARKIKEDYSSKALVIMISSSEWSDIVHEAKSVGVNLYLPKPLFASQIFNCIEKSLDNAGVSRESSHDEVSKGSTLENFAGKRILLAEDIEINREIVLELLNETGIGIDCAENGRVAFEMFKKNPEGYDLVFMDIHMPEVDGITATGLIRNSELEGARTIPIIAMTADVFREEIEKFIAAGMDDHIGKPMNSFELFEKLKKFL